MASDGVRLRRVAFRSQFDNYEATNAPWAPCDNGEFRCHGNGEFAGRISASIAFQAMRERSDRVAVPLVGYGGGVVVSPDVPIMCDSF